MKCRVTQEQFDNKLIEILSAMNASQLLDLPGMYEIVSEEYSNQILEELGEE